MKSKSDSDPDCEEILLRSALAGHPYRVAGGEEVDLGELPTRDERLFGGEKDRGKQLMKPLADQIGDLQEMLYAEGKRKFLFVIQAMDTGGKDGTIKDVFESVNPQGLRCEPFKKPTSKELARDYLWRVHKKVPAKGELVIFNRSHYEDILAVRVRDIAPESVWSKRYDHINDFERMLSDEGCAIVKIFLHISPGEQKRTPAGPPRQSRQALEVQSRRPRRPRPVAEIHERLPGRPRPHLHRLRTLVRHSRRPQVVPQPRRRRHRHQHLPQPRHELPRTRFRS